MIAIQALKSNGPPVAGVGVGSTKTHLPLGPMPRIGGGVTAAGSALLAPIRSRIARERAASPLVQAALGDATIELLPPIETPGARGAAAIARHRIGLPEREGVGDR